MAAAQARLRTIASLPGGSKKPAGHLKHRRTIMGRGILLWLIGIPIPIIILLALIWR